MLLFSVIGIGIIWMRYGKKYLLKNYKTLVVTTAIFTLIGIVVDPLAVISHAWINNPNKVIGVTIINFPIEDLLFAFFVSLAIASFVVGKLEKKIRE